MYVVTVDLDKGYLNPNLNSLKLNEIDRNTSSPPRINRQVIKIKESKIKLTKKNEDGILGWGLMGTRFELAMT